MEDEAGARELYEQLREYEGDDAYRGVIAPWLDRALPGYRTRLEPSAVHGRWWPRDHSGNRHDALLEELYALSRVNDVLLLGFTPDLVSSPEQPGASQPHGVGGWPTISVDQYLEFFSALGMARGDQPCFDPFLHEIAAVHQTEDPHAPIQIRRRLWPALMLGEMLFSRAGVVVSAGTEHAEHGTADCFPLYWTFRRRHRPTADLSHGWGHNSQWATDFRRDYRTARADHLNVDGFINPDEPDDDGSALLLTPAERRDLIRHRTLLRPPRESRALDRQDQWQADLRPYDWRLTVPHDARSSSRPHSCL